MIRGLYASATGMLTLMNKQEVIANNLANVNTTGFKQDYAQITSFHDALVYEMGARGESSVPRGSIGQLSTAVGIGEKEFVSKDGELRQTGASLDIALRGDGFFTIKTSVGEVYTRNGSFTKNGRGMLVDQAGNLVLGEKGPIELSGKEVMIESSGKVLVDGEYVDNLKIRRFDKGGLIKIENNVFSASSKGKPANGVSIKQGYLEESNVDLPRETVDMLITARSYEANQRVLKVHDELLGRVINDVGRSV